MLGSVKLHVRSWVKSGRHLLMLSVSQFDPNETSALDRRRVLLIGGGPIGVASAYIKRFSNHPNQAQPTQE